MGHFEHSYLAKNALKVNQKKLGFPVHKLIQDVVTRWNSTHEMIGQILEQRLAISAVSYESSKPSDQRFILESSEISVLECVAASFVSQALGSLRCRS